MKHLPAPSRNHVPQRDARVRRPLAVWTIAWLLPLCAVASAAPPGVLIHYWNFNNDAALLTPTQTIGGGTMAVAGTYLADINEGFAGLNARNGDAAASHLRVNNPLTAGTMVTAAIPTTGFQNILVKYETRRSANGAGTQSLAYTVDGTTYVPLATFTISELVPVVQTLDFSLIPAANNNLHFGLRITFAQGAGASTGNNRFDDLTVEADALPGNPKLLSGGDAGWNIAANWASGTVPDGAGARAIIGAPASADRAVTLTGPITIGTLEMDNAASAFRNRITGSAGTVLTFNGNANPALLTAAGTGSGYIEFDLPGSAYLATALCLAAYNLEGDLEHGAMRLRGIWDGPGGLIKQGLGVASLTGAGKIFTGPLQIEEGVIQLTQPAAPGQTSGISVHSGGQLRLISGNDVGGARVHSFGGTLVLAGNGRGAAIDNSDHNGVLGALRFDPIPTGTNRASITTAISLSASADIHIDGPGNTLDLAGTFGGAGTLTKSGGGTLVLSSTSPGFAGPLVVDNGPVEINGNWSATPIHLTTTTVLSGAGTCGALYGPGIVAPYLTTLTAPIAAAGSYEFVLAHPGLAGNSLLRLTQSVPFPSAPTNLDLFVNLATRAPGDRLRGGFFTAATYDLTSGLAATQVRLLVPDAGGTFSHLGVNYRSAVPADNLTWAVVDQTHDFGGGPLAGRVLEVRVGGVASQFSQWVGLGFANPADAANPAIAGPQANPAGDGVSNLMRYALGVGPLAAVAAQLPALVPAGSGLALRMRFDPAKSDLIWQVQASGDLRDWSHVMFDSRTNPLPPLDNGYLTLPLPAFLGSGPARNPQIFTRLEVQLAAP